MPQARVPLGPKLLHYITLLFRIHFPDYVIIFYNTELVSNCFLGYVISYVVTSIPYKHPYKHRITLQSMVHAKVWKSGKEELLRPRGAAPSCLQSIQMCTTSGLSPNISSPSWIATNACIAFRKGVHTNWKTCWNECAAIVVVALHQRYLNQLRSPDPVKTAITKGLLDKIRTLKVKILTLKATHMDIERHLHRTNTARRSNAWIHRDPTLQELN